MRYLALEGVDGAGKTTVARGVAERLRNLGREVVSVREPGGTAVGDEVRRLLLHGGDMAPWTEAMLFAAERAQLAAEVILPALEGGATVVSDRSYYSSLAYQGGARGLGVEAVRAVNETVLGEALPDLVVVLWIDPDEAHARQAATDRIGGESGEFRAAVAQAYRRLAEADPDLVRLVAADRPVDVVVAEVVAMMEAAL